MLGQSLGRYTIESKLGEGGMGVVFKARDTQLGRAVAIKILPPDKIANPDRKRRFIQEAKAASALNHPHIVTIYDIGSESGTDFMVMEYLDGATLDQRIPPGGLPLKQAFTFAVAIADALAKAHEAGIVHRDLKPSNVMITGTGIAKVLDFGVAKLLEAEPSAATRTAVVTEEGTTVGTPAYMSPEQADGRKLDSRSDIFSFGSVLYEMVTGRKVPLAGGAPVKVLDGVIFGNFDVLEGGIYYIDRVSGTAGGFFTDRSRGETRLQYFDFATGKTTTVAHNLGAVGPGLTVSRDGRTIFYSRVDSSVDELMLVDNFR